MLSRCAWPLPSCFTRGPAFADCKLGEGASPSRTWCRSLPSRRGHACSTAVIASRLSARGQRDLPPGVYMAGAAREAGAFLGMGALVVPGVTVRKGARVKAGAVVVPERGGIQTA